MPLDIPALQPLDEHNQLLASNVHPEDWQNPIPKGRYHLVVIGAGTAGLVTAAGAAGLGARVALVERELMGGDCLNVGCVPSKGLLSAARAAAAVRSAADFGVTVDGECKVDFADVMQRMRRLRAGISHHDSAKRFQGLGVDVFSGQGTFLDSSTVQVAEQKLSFKKAVIATGARAAKLPIPGWDEVNPLSNETIFSLSELPKKLVVVGGGPIGCEMAQAFARFGAEVHLLEANDHILSREDQQAALIVQESLRRDGVQVHLEASVKRFEAASDRKYIHFDAKDCPDSTLEADQILVATGRQPNLEGLGLEEVSVNFETRSGVQVNDRLQTTNPRIFAAGDVASKYKFTHAADFMARSVIQNALFMGRAKASRLVIPWATYTSPELAQVGLTEKQAEERGVASDTFVQQFSGVDRAILDGETEGFVKVVVKRGTDKILGATVVSEHAGDLISHLCFAMTHGMGLKKLGSTIHPYPTKAEAIRKIGDQYNRTRLTPTVAKLMKTWLNWTR